MQDEQHRHAHLGTGPEHRDGDAPGREREPDHGPGTAPGPGGGTAHAGHGHAEHGQAEHGQAEDGHAGYSHSHGHGHEHVTGRWARVWHQVAHLVTPHSHNAVDKVDSAMEASREGVRTLWLSFAVLGLTTIVQAVVVAVSGSVALLGDTIHNAADALTAVPLGVAFLLGRKAADRRYTYGYGRAEDLAGIAIVLTIAGSSALAAYEAVGRLLHPRDLTHLWAVAVAAVVGFAGNEWVALYRVRTGRRIGSAALVADGLHARADGFTSLAVLLGAGGAALGLRLGDPVVGLLITAAILLVLRDAAREVYRRLMDAVDPALVDAADDALRGVDGVLGLGQVRMRWVGHALRAEADIVVDPHLTVVQAHRVAVEAEHALMHAVPRLTAVTVHTDHTGDDLHAPLAHHHA